MKKFDESLIRKFDNNESYKGTIFILPFYSLIFIKKIFFYKSKMSATKIYDTINNLAFTEKEKTTLRTYFYKNSDEIDKAIGFLNICQTPEAKLDFMKETFLKSGML